MIPSRLGGTEEGSDLQLHHSPPRKPTTQATSEPPTSIGAAAAAAAAAVGEAAEAAAAKAKAVAAAAGLVGVGVQVELRWEGKKATCVDALNEMPRKIKPVSGTFLRRASTDSPGHVSLPAHLCTL